MSLNAETIDRIVANVLGQLSTSNAREALPEPTREEAPRMRRITDRVVTAATLDAIDPDEAVTVLAGAIITPAARDVVREKGLRIAREADNSAPAGSSKRTTSSLHTYLVQTTKPLMRILEERNEVRRELFGCPDDAAKMAISEICRGATGMVVIFAEQVHRAACLMNRNEKVKAAAVRDVGEIKSVKAQLRANAWCIDPTGRSDFELRNLLREIQNGTPNPR